MMFRFQRLRCFGLFACNSTCTLWWGLCQVLIFHFYLCRPKTNTTLWYICLTFGLGLLMLFVVHWWLYFLNDENILLQLNGHVFLRMLAGYYIHSAKSGKVYCVVIVFIFIVLKCTLNNWTSSYDYQINIYSIWLLIIKSSYNIFYIF